MSVRLIPLFDGRGHCTPFLAAQWRQRGARLALPSGAALVTPEGKPNGVFRGLWVSAFPTRPVLPEQVANANGTGTAEFWFVLR